ncbi:hypothetical protein LTR56_026971 [Elasticomyces elasticus]|nr:hypothetical protein LTR56_026971 [Elasticomyces elasticus]KAK3615463.1 hypothetical protein LTR22_027428 [Elasticomyces elasticus]KAK4901930.1 hypothetical protein LTR49_027156 [Elasticomyces elasticus]
MTDDYADSVLSLAVNDHPMVRNLKLDIGPSGNCADAKIVLVSLGSEGASVEGTLQNFKAVGQAIVPIVEGKAAMTGFAMEDMYNMLRVGIEKA